MWAEKRIAHFLPRRNFSRVHREENNMGTGFTAKIKIKRKTLPSSPINVRISASPEEAAEGDEYGSSNPGAARSAAFKFPSSPSAKKTTSSGRRGSFK